MKTRVITAVSKAEENFFSLCIKSQEEWAKAMNYEYQVYHDLFIPNSSISWSRLGAFYFALKEAKEDERIILLYPNVFVLENIDIAQTNDKNISLLADDSLFHIDFLAGSNSERNLKILEFILHFSTLEESPEKAFQQAIKLFPTQFAIIPRKGKIGFFGVNPFSIDVKAVSWKGKEPGTKTIGRDTQKDFLYEIGDFGINLSQNKYIVKELSKNFYDLKKRYHDERLDSERIYEDVNGSW